MMHVSSHVNDGRVHSLLQSRDRRGQSSPTALVVGGSRPSPLVPIRRNKAGPAPTFISLHELLALFADHLPTLLP